MKFTAAVSGYVTGVKFFKGTGNGGTHTGKLWNSAGALLASVTFINETSSGWQVAYFPTPAPIAANTTYVISYYAPKGHTAADNGYFTNHGVSNPPLLALADGQNGPNGVYTANADAFPASDASGTNYWVDVVFNMSPWVGTAKPDSLWTATATPTTPAAPGSTAAGLGTEFMSEVPGYVSGVRFYKSTGNTGTHTGYLWTSAGILLGSMTFTNESAQGWQQANFASPIAIAANTIFVVSYWAPNGNYADDAGYFGTSGVTNQPLAAPVNGLYGPNGLFSSKQRFPGSAPNSNNYWVDVVFTTAIQ